MPDCFKDIIKGSEIFLEGALFGFLEESLFFGSLWWVIFAREMQTRSGATVASGKKKKVPSSALPLPFPLK